MLVWQDVFWVIIKKKSFIPLIKKNNEIKLVKMKADFGT